MRDRSLEEFVGGEAEAGESDVDDAGDEGTEVEDSVEPATVTYGWSPEGAPCDACETVVERRWRDGDDAVCSACKNW